MTTVYSSADPAMTRCERKLKNLEVHQSYKVRGLSWSSVYSGIPTKQTPMPVMEWMCWQGDSNQGNSKSCLLLCPYKCCQQEAWTD